MEDLGMVDSPNISSNTFAGSTQSTHFCDM